MGAAALLVHYSLGKLLYGVSNTSASGQFQNWTTHMRMSFGYGISAHSLQAGFDELGRNGGSSYNSNLVSRPTIDLGFNMEYWSIRSNNYGIGMNAGVAAGHGFLFETFKYYGDVGLKTYFGPLAFNASSTFGQLNFNTWIDETVSAEEKVSFSNGRIELGVHLGKNGADHNILFVMQRRFSNFPDQEKLIGYGGRYEGGNSNRLRFIAEFIAMPIAYGTTVKPSGEDVGMPFQLYLGVLNSIDNYMPSFANSYDKRILYEANKKHTWFVGSNVKLMYGDIKVNEEQYPENGYYRRRPNIQFQWMLEKNILITDGLFANLGAGASVLRSFDGEYHSPDGVLPTPELDGETPGDINYGHVSLDFPVGLLYTIKPKSSTDWAPWFAFNTELVWDGIKFTEAGERGYDGAHEVFDEPQLTAFYENRKSFYTMLQLGAGLDHFYNLSKRVRWGVFYQFAPASLYENWDYRPHGVTLSVKKSF